MFHVKMRWLFKNIKYSYFKLLNILCKFKIIIYFFTICTLNAESPMQTEDT